MKIPTRHTVVVTLVGIVALVQSGCAGKRFGRPSLEEVRGQLGVIGVFSPSDAPKTELPDSGRGVAAGRGALAGAKAGAVAGAAPGMAVAFAGGVLMPIPFVGAPLLLGGIGLAAAGGVAGGTLGALGGALHGASNAEITSTETGVALGGSVVQPSVQERLRDSVFQAATRQTSLTFVPLPTRPAPKSAGAKVAYAGDATVDTILEVAFQRIELTREGEGRNPQVTLVTAARARLVRAGDGRELYRHIVTHTSVARPFDEWAANDAHHFREAFSEASTNMAQEVIDALFVRSEPAAPTVAPASPRPTEPAPPRSEYQWKASGSRERATKEAACRNQHLAFRSDWRDRLPEYRACLEQ